MNTQTTLRVKVLALLLLWFGFVGVSNAALVDDYQYLGDMTLDTTSYPGLQYFATNDCIAGGCTDGGLFFTAVEHLYKFSLTEAISLFNIYAEFRSGSTIVVSIYDSTETQIWQNSSVFNYIWDGPGNDRDSEEIVNIPVSWAAGDYWLLIQADPAMDAGEFSYTGSYDFYLQGKPTTVPLPPALLLFGSTLIGFFTLGWRWRV